MGYPEKLWRSHPWRGQGQIEQGPGQSGLVGGVPAHGKEVGTRLSLRSLRSQTSLWFCDFLRTCSKARALKEVKNI